MTFVYELGEAIDVGSHGEHDYVYANGKEVFDSGLSTHVFESGTGIGGDSTTWVVTQDDVFESGKSHVDFYDFTSGPDPQAQGLDSVPIDTKEPDAYLYFCVHYYSTSDTYCMINWGVNGGGRSEYKIVFNDFGNQAFNPGAPLIQDNLHGDAGSYYDTNSVGDPVQWQSYSDSKGDGAGYEFSDLNFTISLDITENPNADDTIPPRYTTRTPDKTNQIDNPLSDTDTTTLTIKFDL